VESILKTVIPAKAGTQFIRRDIGVSAIWFGFLSAEIEPYELGPVLHQDDGECEAKTPFAPHRPKNEHTCSIMRQFSH